MYEIIYTHRYVKLAKRFFKKHPDLLERYRKTLLLLEADPYHKSLRIHKLTGRLEGIFSVSINMKYRITIEFIIDEKTIIPVSIGSHSEIY
ncbi:MAG: type II toxin-antitoxin system YafQ family toxin [Sedimentisphaeraceae bacterium JB056]